MLKFINRIGLELEGGWVEVPDTTDEIHEDVSVRNGHDGFPILKKGEKACLHWGEIASKPVTFQGAMTFLDANFPDDTNGSCGFHIHISVKRTIDYARLMKRDFYTQFLAEVDKWAKEERLLKTDPFWERLAGKNRFAKKVFRPAAQMAVTEKVGAGAGLLGTETRRTLLNYCWSMHKTLECRLFPAWTDKARCKSAVKFFVEFVEGYLTEKAKRKMKLAKTYIVLKERDMRRRGQVMNGEEF